MENDYISREAAKSKKVYSVERHEYVVPVADLDWLPAADVRPVEHGEWLPIIEGNEFGEAIQTGCYCSECGEALQHEPNFCPNCGTDMRPEPSKEAQMKGEMNEKD